MDGRGAVQATEQARSPRRWDILLFCIEHLQNYTIIIMMELYLSYKIIMFMDYEIEKIGLLFVQEHVAYSAASIYI